MSVLLLIVGGMCFLQVVLSKREGMIPGLIIPAAFFLLSLIYVLDMVVNAYPSGECWLTFLFMNIPTFICLVIYFICREKYRKKNQINRMNIQDLD